MLELTHPLRFPVVLVQRFLATINVIRTVVSEAVLAIVAAAGVIRVGIICVRRRVRSCMAWARKSIFHVEGEVVRL
jgi:hypothetical protein